jgi:lipopolysaccharide transport system ATP-binding protein
MKCLGKMDEVSREGRTVLFVSHNMDAVSTLCDRVIWLDQGQIFLDGPAQEVVHHYCDSMLSTEGQARNQAGVSQKLFYFKRFYPADEEGNLVQSVKSGVNLNLILEYACKEEVRSANVLVNVVFGHSRIPNLFSCPYEFTSHELASLPLEGKLVCKIPNFPLVPGIYEVRCSASVNELLTDKLRGLIQAMENDDPQGTPAPQGNARLSRLRGVFLKDFQWQANK